MFDPAWVWGGVINPPELGVQTVSVPPGGALIVDFKIEVPGRYILVDHALSRMERGLVGFLFADRDAPQNIISAIFHGLLTAIGHELDKFRLRLGR